jgi:hypothetical protein
MLFLHSSSTPIVFVLFAGSMALLLLNQTGQLFLSQNFFFKKKHFTDAILVKNAGFSESDQSFQGKVDIPGKAKLAPFVVEDITQMKDAMEGRSFDAVLFCHGEQATVELFHETFGEDFLIDGDRVTLKIKKLENDGEYEITNSVSVAAQGGEEKEKHENAGGSDVDFSSGF